MTILSWAALSVSPRISEESRQWKEDELPPYTLIPYVNTLTGMLQELAGALAGKERFLQSSEVELQHSSDRIQVICTLREGILSYEVNIQPTNKYRGGWSWLKHTLLPLSNASLRLLISIWEPGTRNIPSWWRPGRQIWLCPLCQMYFLNVSPRPQVHTLTIQVDKAHTTLYNDWNLLSWYLNKNTSGH